MKEKYARFRPNVYTKEEQAVLDNLNADIKARLGTVIKTYTVSQDSLTGFARLWDQYNTAYFDPEVAAKTRWGGLIAYPGTEEPSAGYPMLDENSDVFGNVFYYGSDGGDMEFFKPIRPGDELSLILEDQHIEDITEPDSDCRKLLLIGTAALRSSNGELVARGTARGRNSIMKIIDGSPVPSNYEQCFEWKTYENALTPHHTTPEEWERIKQLWRSERVRGMEPLYWEDVMVGDELIPTCSGPISVPDLIRWHGDLFAHFPTTRQWMELDEDELMTDPNGVKVHQMARHYFDCHVPNSGAIFYNQTARNHVFRTVINWMGWQGRITKYGWRFCNLFNAIRDDSSGADLLAKVPYMAGKACNRHGIEGDTVIGRGYVTGKSRDDTGCYAELVCWAEDIVGNVLQVVPITVELPGRN